MEQSPCRRSGDQEINRLRFIIVFTRALHWSSQEERWSMDSDQTNQSDSTVTEEQSS